MKKTLTFGYWYGDKVTLVTDPEKKIRIISGITIRPSGRMYELAFGENTTWHQSVEIEPVKVVEVKGFR